MRKSIISICLIICILYSITKNVYALDGWIEENGETYYLINLKKIIKILKLTSILRFRCTSIFHSSEKGKFCYQN